MTKTINIDLFSQLLKQAKEIYSPGCGGHSRLFERWLRHLAASLTEIRFTGIYIPGVNRFNFAELNNEVKMQVFFLSNDFRKSYEADQIDYLPIAYTEINTYLASHCNFDISLIQVSLPNEKGDCSFGIASDFTPAALSASKMIIAHINPNMPFTDGPKINLKLIDYVVESEENLLQIPDEEPSEQLVKVAQNVATLIDTGSTLQFGLGKLQTALFRELNNKRDLKIHSGMISDSLLNLVGNGNIASLTDKGKPIKTGVALGSTPLYDFCANSELVEFAPVSKTHSLLELAQIDNFVSINSALEIDLFCQLNVDCINGQQVSGVGGLTDFIRGSQYSKDGKSIIAFPAIYGKNTNSRIIKQLNEKNLCSVSRLDIDYVVTENGVADLKYLTIKQKADALIDIADPKHKDTLKIARDRK